MTEALRQFLPPTELQLPSENLMLEQGIQDFNQALEFAATTSSESINAIGMVAKRMSNVGIKPYKALDILEGYSNPNSMHMEHRNVARASVFAMLGQEDKMREVLNNKRIPKEWRLSPYIQAIKTRVRNGIDPREMVEEAMGTVAQIPDRDEPYGDEHDFRASEYLSIAKQLVELGQDETAPLIKAKEEMGSSLKRDFFHSERELQGIIYAYSEAGNHRQAEEMLKFMIEGQRSHTYYESKMAVVDAYVNAGNFDGALNFARSHKAEGAIPAVLAKKAVFDAEQGIDVTLDVARITGMDEVVVDEDRFKDIFPLLGIALAKSGATQQAQEVFTMIEDAIRSDHIHLFDKPDVYLALANAVHDAGMDSDEIFTRLWNYYEEWTKDEEIDSWSHATPALGFVYEDIIRDTIERGKLEHARKAIDDEGNVGWWKALHLADLAEYEVKASQKKAA